MNQHYDVIVIGTGIGGLACASALSKTGQKVLALEQHYVAGGMTHTFKRKEFIWDVGVHCMGEMEPKRFPRRILNWICDGRIEMNHYDDVYDSFYFKNGMKVELPSSKDKFFNDLMAKFPQEKTGILAYQDAINQAAKSANQFFMMKMIPRSLVTLASPLIARKFKKWSQKTTKSVVDELIQDPMLKTILTAQWGYYGPPPSLSSFFIHSVTIRHFWGGGYYPVGGSIVFAKEIGKTITDHGGEIRTRAKVKQVIFEHNKAVGVELEKGEIIKADKIVSAIGAKATVNNLIDHSKQQSKWAQDILKLDMSPCHVALYLGLKGDIKAAGGTPSNQWFFETTDMEDHEWDVNDPKSIAPILYVSFPSLKDPKHQGDSHTVEVVTFVPYAAFSKWAETNRGKRGEDYNQFKQDLENRLLEQLFKWRPKLRDLVVYQEFSTPLSTEFYCKSTEGAIYGLSPTPQRFKCKSLRPDTPYKNFYLAGSDVGTLGVVGAMVGGLLSATKIQPKIWKEVRS